MSRSVISQQNGDVGVGVFSKTFLVGGPRQNQSRPEQVSVISLHRFDVLI